MDWDQQQYVDVPDESDHDLLGRLVADRHGGTYCRNNKLAGCMLLISVAEL